jgi:polysaccharide biosynthesis/export protein
MIHKLLLIFALSATLCAGQDAPIASPGEATSPTSADDTSTRPAASQNGMPVRSITNVPSLSTPNLATGTASNPAAAPARRGESAAVPMDAPPTVRSEFELFVEDAAGHPLPVYGRELFNQVPTTFAPVDQIPVVGNYALGPGDQLLIRVWGKIDLDTTVTVDRNGQIYLPKVGALSVGGLRYEQIESYLRSAIGNLYKGFELNVTLGQLRSIQVFVLGSARRPGVYTVSSLSTLVNAIFASGGPSATGSMRDIQLRRDGHLVTELDSYDLLRKGDKSRDTPLLPGDVIYVPPIGPQVAILGSVNEPGIYELKGDTTIAAVLEEAGGLTSLAGNERIQLERIENHRRRRVDDFPLDGSSLQRSLRDGDMLEIFPISPRFENAITLRGNVAKPGRFPWHEGMRVSDVIPSRDFLITSGYWEQQNHVAGNSQTEMLGDLSQDTAEINWSYAAVQRLDDHDLSTRLIPFNLANAIDDPGSPDNKLLKAGDVVTIFSRKDLPLPEDKHASFVRVAGEVNIPGVYRIAPDETLREVVERAGGLTVRSYLYASQFTRESTRRIQEEQLKLSIHKMQNDLKSRVAAGEASPAQTALAALSQSPQIALEQESQVKAEQDLIAQLGDVRPTGRVVLGLKPDAHSVADIPEFPLEDGDSFYVPPTLGTVQVSGEVYNANAFRYQPKRHLGSYLRDSGGPARTADVKRIYLIRADGTVVSNQSSGSVWHDNFEDLALMPGDAIVVPPKLKLSPGFMAELPMITQILSQTAMTGAVVSILQ